MAVSFTPKQYRFALGLIIGVALFARFFLAPQTSVEARGDVLLFELWGFSAIHNGLTNVYDVAIGHPAFPLESTPNYLPPMLYIVQVGAWVHDRFEDTFNVGTPLASVIFKTPAILFDLATVLLLAWIVRKKWGSGWALGLGLTYAFLPPIFYESAGWGQVDAINTFFMVLCVWWITQRKLTLATVAFVVAFFFKMQSLVLLPLLLYEIWRMWHIRRWANVMLAGFATAAVLCAPFLLAGKFRQILQVMVTSAGSYPHPSVNAFNFWWFFSGGHWLARSDTTPIFGVQPLHIGAVLFFAAVGFAIWFRYHRRDDVGAWLTAAFLAFAFFMLPTEMHERYLFPFFALLLPILPAFRPARWLFGILSVTFLWNLIVVVLIIASSGRILGNFWGGSLIVATINALAFVGTVVWYARMARKPLPA